MGVSGGGARAAKAGRTAHAARAARGFTIVELAITFVLVVVVVAVVGAVLLPELGRTDRGGARQLKDAVQVRGVLQGMVIWAGNNQDRYPLPSVVDVKDATVPEVGAAKDTTANIFSLMVYQGLVPVDLCVSPAEADPNIGVIEGYEFKSPKKAVRPDEAQWDPAFSADFTAGKSHLSYAHTPPAGARMKEWVNTFNAEMPVVGNRGPEIAAVKKKKAPKVACTLANPKSYTLLIHGPRDTWEGNIGYNDNHVNFETAAHGIDVGHSKALSYKDASGTAWHDVIFYDEPDDPSGANAYLGVFTKAGTAVEDWKAIWD